jgi:hypothetical protein
MLQPLVVPIDRRDNRLIIDIRYDGLETWCFRLCLLLMGDIEQIALRDAQGNHKVHIGYSGAVKPNQRGTVQLSDQLVTLDLSSNELGYWQRFFIQWYLNTKTDVDHIDFEPLSFSDTHLDVVLRVVS